MLAEIRDIMAMGLLAAGGYFAYTWWNSQGTQDLTKDVGAIIYYNPFNPNTEFLWDEANVSPDYGFGGGGAGGR